MINKSYLNFLTSMIEVLFFATFKNMIILLFSIIGTALKCYRCNEGCPVDRAETITCGTSIGPAQEAFCVKRPKSGKYSPTIVNFN